MFLLHLLGIEGSLGFIEDENVFGRDQMLTRGVTLDVLLNSPDEGSAAAASIL